MKFVCGHCKAKYQIGDDRVGGRTLRMTCRSCGHEILIRSEPQAPGPHGAPLRPISQPLAHPHAPPHPPPPPSPLGSDFRAAMSPAAHSLPPPPPRAAPPDEWHVALDDQPVGPIRREDVAHKLGQGALGPDSLAWREGLDDWMPIREIPELRVLCGPISGMPAPAAPPPSPIGGRAGAAPAFAVEDWAPVPERTPAVAPSALSDPDLSVPRGPRMPSMSVMFALACGFAFLMSVLAIVAARWLSAAATANAPAGAPVAAQAAVPAAAVEERPAKETVIELDDPLLDEGEPAQKGRTGGAARGTPGAKPKKELSAEQRAMLERMGGATGSDFAGLPRDNGPSGGPARAGGSLTAAELSSVVNRNKKQLQRCYETALRGAGSEDTVRLDVTVDVSASGNVGSVEIGGQGLPGMGDCIKRMARGWRFPSAAEPSQLRFPLVFQPGA